MRRHVRDTNKTQRQDETGHLRDNRKSRRGGQDRTRRGVEGGLEDWAVSKDTHKQSRRPTTRHKQTPDTQKPVSGHSQNPDPQDAQTARDRADEDDRSIPRRDSTDRPTERLTHPPRGKLPPQSAVGAARRAGRGCGGREWDIGHGRPTTRGDGQRRGVEYRSVAEGRGRRGRGVCGARR